MPPALDTSLGVLLLGVILNVLLLGVFWVQAYIYLNTQKKESPWIRLMVFFLLFVDNLNSGLDIAMIYEYTIKNFGNYEQIQIANWMFDSDSVTTGVIAATVQIFFAWRIRVLTGYKWLSGSVVILSIISMLCSFGAAIGAVTVKARFSEFHLFTPVVTIWLVGTVITDVVITIVLVWHLSQHRTGFVGTDTLITKLIRITVSTGMITSVVAVLDLIFFLSMTNTVHLIFNLPLAKLYTNCLMSSLNARTFWLAEEGGGNIPSSTVSTKWGLNRGLMFARRSPKQTGIHVTTSALAHPDGGQTYELQPTNSDANASQRALAQKAAPEIISIGDEAGDV